MQIQKRTEINANCKLTRQDASKKCSNDAVEQEKENRPLDVELSVSSFHRSLDPKAYFMMQTYGSIHDTC